MKDAKTWKELHQKLAEGGLRFEKKGSGAIVFVGKIAVKASSVDRAFSLKNLCKKLGEFEPGNYALILDTIEPEPVSSVNLEEWKQYRAEIGSYSSLTARRMKTFACCSKAGVSSGRRAATPGYGNGRTMPYIALAGRAGGANTASRKISS